MIGENPMVGGVIHVLATSAPRRRRAVSATGVAAPDTARGPVVRRTRVPQRPATTEAPLVRAPEPSPPPPLPPLADDDDMSLIRAYRNGDVRAFEVFFSRYRDR